MKLLLGPFLPSLLKVLTLAACSAESASGPSAACNDLVHDGSTHPVALASNPATPLLGGTISEGNYVLTSARLFNVPGNVNFMRQLGASLEVRGDIIEQVTQVDGTIARSTFKYTVGNTTLSLVDTCTASGAKDHGFSATTTRLEILSEEPGTGYTLHQIYTKR